MSQRSIISATAACAAGHDIIGRIVSWRPHRVAVHETRVQSVPLLAPFFMHTCSLPAPLGIEPKPLDPTSQTDTQAVEDNKKIRTLWSDWTSRSAVKGSTEDSSAAALAALPSAAEAIAAARGSPPQRSQVCGHDVRRCLR